MRRSILPPAIGAFLVLTLFLGSGCTPRQQTEGGKGQAKYKVGVFLAADHPVIEQFRSGFVDHLEEKPWIKQSGVSYTVRNAGGDATALNTIAAEMADSDLDAIYVVGVPASQALLKRRPKAPVICGGSFDPLEVGLAESWEHPGKGATGATALAPVSRQLDLLRQMFPRVKSLAILYSPGEAQASAVAKDVEKTAPTKGIHPVLVPVSTTSEVKAALAKAESADAYYVGTDNMMHSVIQTIANAALESKKPLINCSEASVQKGALFSLAVDYYQVGKVAADLMDAVVLEKKDASLVPFKKIENPALYVNTRTARALGVSFPSHLLAKAKTYPQSK